MTLEEMDRKIAEAVGWKLEFVGLQAGSGSYVWVNPDGEVALFPPRYSTDLNAMHEAEKAAFKSSNLWLDFACNILSVLKAADMSAADGMTCVLQTTAAQRAEAFLRTVGKWRDE